MAHRTIQHLVKKAENQELQLRSTHLKGSSKLRYSDYTAFGSKVKDNSKSQQDVIRIDSCDEFEEGEGKDVKGK